MNSTFELTNKNDIWYAKVEIRFPGNNESSRIISVGRETPSQAIDELINDIRNECDKIITESNMWLRKLEKAGLPHSTTPKEIVFREEEKVETTNIPPLPSNLPTRGSSIKPPQVTAEHMTRPIFGNRFA